MMRLITGAVCLMIASLSTAGDQTADHIHHDSAHHKHPQSGRYASPLHEARHLQRHHDFSRAAEILNELLEEEPLNREAQLLYADVLLHDGRVDQARAACVRVAVSGAHTLAGFCAVQVLTAIGEHAHAFETATGLSYDLLQNDAKNWALEIAAVAAWKAGHRRQADKWFNEALALPVVPHSTTQAYSAFLNDP